jgi:glutamate racemase
VLRSPASDATSSVQGLIHSGNLSPQHLAPEHSGQSIGQSVSPQPVSCQRPQQPIGVFDSGVGGLTVLQSLREHMPQESFLYFGDTAHVPYGIRSAAEIITYGREILTWMAQQQVKMAIMACNTSSALALEAIRSEFDFPILGLILPAARAAIHQGRKVGVIATPATVKSACYPKAVDEIVSQRSYEVDVVQVECPEFVTLVEQGRIHDLYTRQVARKYLEPLIDAEIDTLIYGCTHFPHLKETISGLLPPQVNQIDPAHHVAAAAAKELEMLGLQHSAPKTLSDRFYVSGCAQQFAKVAQQLMGETLEVKSIDVSAPVAPALVQGSAPNVLPAG